MTDEELAAIEEAANSVARPVRSDLLRLVDEVRRLRALCEEAADWIAAVEEARR